MRLTISHQTTYTYEAPQSYGLERIRLFPLTGATQTVVNWNVSLTGASKEAAYDDHHGNRIWLAKIDKDQTSLMIACQGTVEVAPGSGVSSPKPGRIPLWHFQRPTALTQPGAGTRALLKALGSDFDNDIARLHALSDVIHKRIAYKADETGPKTTAEEALKAGAGVCQDHAQVFVTAARTLGFPARYVSGYLMMDDRIDQNATHAWAEAFVDGLGWLGFDVSNEICPDERYVRIATGCDYRDAAPVTGMRMGEGSESMMVAIQVQQQ